MANPDIDISYSEVITTIEHLSVDKIASIAIDEAVAYFTVILAGKGPVQWETVRNYLAAAFAPMLLEVEKDKGEPITQFVWQYATLEVLGSPFSDYMKNKHNAIIACRTATPQSVGVLDEDSR